MKYGKITIYVVLVLLITTINSFSSDSLNLIKEANNHLSKGNTVMAIKSLEQARFESSDDPDIMFNVGLIYHAMSNVRMAITCFEEVINQAPNQHVAAAGHYFYEEGRNTFNKKRYDEAERLFLLCFKALPNKSSKTIRQIHGIGMQEWNQGHRKTAYNCFMTAHKLDKATGKKTAIGDKISNFYYNTCMQTGKPCLNFLKRSCEFSDKNLPNIVAYIKKLHSVAENDQQKDDIRDYLLLFISSKERDKEISPDYEILNPGQYKVVALLNGEKPKKYLRLPSTGYPFKIGRSHDQTNFCIKTRTGLIIPFSKIRTSNFFLDHRDFMIIPTDKNIVKIGIKT
ncbi:tetratricopeptide repeat protein [Candidatus Parcubacteria bacterium]|nr:tetratricopeptide repeat protein [Candidatus Parcubacteria bacterium]